MPVSNLTMESQLTQEFHQLFFKDNGRTSSFPQISFTRFLVAPLVWTRPRFWSGMSSRIRMAIV